MTDIVERLNSDADNEFYYAWAQDFYHEDILREAAAEITRLRERVAELEDVLLELSDLMDGVIEGDYKPDSFTTQPARSVLRARMNKEPGSDPNS